MKIQWECMSHTGRSLRLWLSQSWIAGDRDIEHQALKKHREDAWLGITKKKMAGGEFYTITLPLNAQHVQTMDNSFGYTLISSCNFLCAYFPQ